MSSLSTYDFGIVLPRQTITPTTADIKTTMSAPLRNPPVRKRLSLDLEEATHEKICRLVASSNNTTISGLIRAALALYDVTVQHEQSGGKLIFRHPDGKEETIILLRP